MFCKNCGQILEDSADACMHCGCFIYKNHFSLTRFDQPSHLPGIAGFFFPLVGIILYFTWKGDKPRSASLVIKWTLTSIAIRFIVIILYILFIAILVTSYY